MPAYRWRPSSSQTNVVISTQNAPIVTAPEGYDSEMKRKLENSEANSESKHKKMDENTPLEVNRIQHDNSDKIKFIDNKNGIERTSIQKSHAVKKLVIKNFGMTVSCFRFV